MQETQHFCKCLSGDSAQCQQFNFTRSLFQKELNNFCSDLSALFSLKSFNFSVYQYITSLLIHYHLMKGLTVMHLTLQMMTEDSGSWWQMTSFRIHIREKKKNDLKQLFSGWHYIHQGTYRYRQTGVHTLYTFKCFYIVMQEIIG